MDFFFGYWSCHELCDCVERVEVFEEDCVDGLCDWHVYVELVCEFDDCSCCFDAFDDHDGFFEVLVEWLTFAECFAAGAVSSFWAEACCCEVSYSCDSEEGFAVCSECDAESCDFGESSCEEC